jgi:hypothetical protein
LTFKRQEGAPRDALTPVPVVVGAGFPIEGSLGQDVVDHAQQGVRDCHHAFLRPAVPQRSAKGAMTRSISALKVAIASSM